MWGNYWFLLFCLDLSVYFSLSFSLYLSLSLSLSLSFSLSLSLSLSLFLSLSLSLFLSLFLGHYVSLFCAMCNVRTFFFISYVALAHLLSMMEFLLSLASLYAFLCTGMHFSCRCAFKRHTTFTPAFSSMTSCFSSMSEKWSCVCLWRPFGHLMLVIGIPKHAQTMLWR